MNKTDFLKHNCGVSCNWLVHKIVMSALYDLFEKYIQGGKLIDIGCGTKPLASYFKGRVDEHIGFDHPDCIHTHNNIDVLGDVYNMPFEDETFDYAISTAVLEHLEEPQKAINQTCRILKKGGIAIFSAPFIWHIHEAPRDFFRYSEFGLKHLFEKAGFETLELIPLSGFWVTFGTLLCYNIERDKHFKLIRKLKLKNFVMNIIQKTAEKMDKKCKNTDWTWMTIIVAQKN